MKLEQYKLELSHQTERLLRLQRTYKSFITPEVETQIEKLTRYGASYGMPASLLVDRIESLLQAISITQDKRTLQ